MDFDDTADEAAWRAEVRTFLEEHKDALGERAETTEFDETVARRRQALLYDAGYVGVTWPVEAGGRGGTPMQQAIVDQEMTRAGIPGLVKTGPLGTQLRIDAFDLADRPLAETCVGVDELDAESLVEVVLNGSVVGL